VFFVSTDTDTLSTSAVAINSQAKKINRVYAITPFLRPLAGPVYSIMPGG
jgi:hypothetical protein